MRRRSTRRTSSTSPTRRSRRRSTPSSTPSSPRGKPTSSLPRSRRADGDQRRREENTMIVTSPIDELRSWTRAQAVAVSKGWWVLLLTGVVSILAGGIIVFTKWTVDDLVVFVGALLIVRGAMTMFSVPVDGSLRTWSIVLGVVEVFVGI